MSNRNDCITFNEVLAFVGKTQLNKYLGYLNLPKKTLKKNTYPFLSSYDLAMVEQEVSEDWL